MSSTAKPRFGIVEEIGVKLSVSKVWFSSRKTGEPPCLSGRPMRLKPKPSQVPESSARNPKSSVTCGRLCPLRIDEIVAGIKRFLYDYVLLAGLVNKPWPRVSSAVFKPFAQ